MKLENRISRDTVAGLEQRGQAVEEWPELTRAAGAVCTIVHDRENGRLFGGADPRRQSGMMGW